MGLLECARRLNLSLNTIKRYDRASEPERLQRVPKYRPTLVNPHRDYLRKRRAEEPGVPVQQLLREIRERGYQGSSNLLVRYINQGRVDSDRPHLSPRRASRILLTRPDRLTAGQHETLAELTAACPEMTALTSLITSFAALLVPGPGNDAALQQWITGARAADLPHLHSFTRGLDLDIQAATAAVTLPHHNGRTEGVNTKTKMIKRQMYGARLHPAAPPHPPQLRLRNVTTESATEPYQLCSPWCARPVLSARRAPVLGWEWGSGLGSGEAGFWVCLTGCRPGGASVTWNAGVGAGQGFIWDHDRRPRRGWQRYSR